MRFNYFSLMLRITVVEAQYAEDSDWFGKMVWHPLRRIPMLYSNPTKILSLSNLATTKERIPNSIRISS